MVVSMVAVNPVELFLFGDFFFCGSFVGSSMFFAMCCIVDGVCWFFFKKKKELVCRDFPGKAPPGGL